MRTSLALLAGAMLASAPVVLADEAWWPTTTKHWGWPPKSEESTDCDESTTSYWKPPPPPPTTTCTDEEETSASYSETTITVSITSCPGGCVETTLTSSYVAAPTSSYVAPISLTLAPTTSYSAPPPPPSSTYAPVNTTTSIAKPTLTVPLGGAAQNGLSFTAVMVGAVGALFAML